MGHVHVSNEALLFACRQVKQESLVAFGDRGWEAVLLHHRDLLLDKNRVVLGVILMERLARRKREMGDDYAERFRHALTIGLAPLYFHGHTFTLIHDDDLATVDIVYPANNLDAQQGLVIDVTLALQDANPAWQTLFTRVLDVAKLTPDDQRFVLMVVAAACNGEEQYRVAQERERAQPAEASKATIVLSMQREKEEPQVIEPIKPRWLLDDIGGCYEAKRRIADLAWLMVKPAAASAWGRSLPTGLLISGPPGTGKTMLVHALAAHANRRLYSASMTDIFTRWYGGSPQRLRNHFVTVVKSGGILFLDEADGIVSSRGGSTTHEESVRVVNEFCKQMELLPTDGSVLVVLATNFQGNLDEAAIRAKRIDLVIKIDRPDERERLDILKVHVATARKLTDLELFAPDVDWAAVAKVAAGFSGADLAAVVDAVLLRKAVLLARTDKVQSPVTADEVMMAMERQRADRIKDVHVVGFNAATSS